jgi:hypothetical protein
LEHPKDLIKQVLEISQDLALIQMLLENKRKYLHHGDLDLDAEAL